MSVDSQGSFKVKKITKINDLMQDSTLSLPESDLCIQNDEFVIQLEYSRPEKEVKYEIEPGVHTLVSTSNGLVTSKIELNQRVLLETVDNTTKIINEAKTFFNKLEVYEMLKRPKKRGVLLYSKPGCGKTSAIEKFCLDTMKNDPGTVVLVWPTSNVEADDVVHFLNARSEYKQECTKLILIIEDIGGGESEGRGGHHGVESGLLNLLDGVGVTFKLPTFIVATTNHPENLLESLADRPGRFDLMLELRPPSLEERIKLLSFISKRDLSDEEKKSINLPGTEDFSIAHLEEIVVRSLLHNKTYGEVVQELVAHSKRYKKSFEKEKDFKLGL